VMARKKPNPPHTRRGVLIPQDPTVCQHPTQTPPPPRFHTHPHTHQVRTGKRG